jgi:DNA-binding GntR family transcriptional regulator
MCQIVDNPTFGFATIATPLKLNPEYQIMNSPDAIRMLRTKSLTNVVHEELERQIIAGDVLPGDALREISIAADMGISRGPVREAFRILEERGLVLVEKNCGVFVRRLDANQAAQIYQVRVPLEGLVGQLAARSVTVAGKTQIRNLLDRMQECVVQGDTSAYGSLNLDFHDNLALQSGNQVLYETYRKLVTQLKLFRSHTFKYQPETIGISLQEHRRIFEAIAANDEALASELLQAHARDSLSRLRMTLADEMGEPLVSQTIHP